MKKIVIIYSALLIGSFSLSAMQQTAAKNHGAINYQNHEERIKKMENHLQLDNRYYDHLSSYSANMFLNAECLYWTAENEGFQIGFNFPKGEDNFLELTSLERAFHYGPGFRIGLGYKPHIDWDLYLSYTYFHHTSKDKFSGDIYPYGIGIQGRIAHIESSLKIKYDILDLELGRFFHVGQTLSLRPHIGLIGGWIKQIGTNRGSGLIDESPDPLQPFPPIYVNYHEKIWLIGPRAGFDLELFFSKNYGFSLYGSLSGALVYENINYNRIATSSTQTGGIHSTINSATKNKDELVGTLQSSIGLSWGDFLTDSEDVALNIRAGWECNIWFDQYTPNDLVVYEKGAYSVMDITENLVLQGFVLSTRIDF